METDGDTAISEQRTATIVSVAADSACAELIMDIVGHPKGLVSHKEFTIVNPSLSGSVISKRLSKLQEAGVVDKVDSLDQSPGEPRAYYYLTDEARTMFDRNEMFAPNPLRELFDQIEHSSEFLELLEKPRPDVDVETAREKMSPEN